MESMIAAALLVVVLGLAIRYLCKAKKRGEKCIGCPYGKSCGANGKSCGCGNSKS